MKAQISLAILYGMAFAAFSPIRALSAVQVTADWATQGSYVHFHLKFTNTGSVASNYSQVLVDSKEFGAFANLTGSDSGRLENIGLPEIAPGNSYDYSFDAVLSLLHKTFEIPDNAACPPSTYWDGGIEVQSDVHSTIDSWISIGDLQACPGAGPSFIHVRSGGNGTGPSWNLGASTAGWNAALVNEDFSQAANPLPPGWTGYISVTALPGVTIGSTCVTHITCFLSAYASPQTIDLTTTACECSLPTPVVASTWATIKALYR